jgi:ATP-dependent DNA helicase PIF1
MKHVEDSNEILHCIRSGDNVFITGSAGSGKTYLASEFGRTHSGVAITATTGVASLTVNGETIHRLLGLGISSRPFEAAKILGKWDRIKKSTMPWDRNKWALINNINTIVIDEISMLRRDQFELIDIVLSSIRDTPIPFGGVQMVLVGDFFQLPPVVTTYDINKYPDLKDPYCFQSEIWNQSGFESFNLTSNYRQSEGEFLDALELIRVGIVTDEVEDILKSRVNADLNIPMDPVKLFSLKADVSKENLECLKKLPGDKLLSEADFSGKKYDCDILAKECPAETKLYFCVGAQVMMLTNDPAGKWVNGTMGIIRKVSPVQIQLSNGRMVTVEESTWERHVPKINKINKKVETEKVATMKQYPFTLAWATSQHKSQGLTLDYVEVDLSKCFVPGQAYVALSRCKTLEGLTLRSWDKKYIKADPKVRNFYGLK